MDQLRIRGNIIIICFALVFIGYGARLFSIQVLSKDYARRADRVVIHTKSVIPPRGNIFNRHGEIYVSNEPLFKMQVIMRELFIPDTSILLKHLKMTQQELDRALHMADSASYNREYPIAHHIELETLGALKEELWNFGGISFSPSNKRQYAHKVGANVLGYIREADKRDIEASGGTYQSGDLIGKTGIERSHDTNLRGVQGKRKVLVDRFGREVGTYLNERYDVPAIKGKDIMLGIDTELQLLGEQIMQNKKGSIVAIEPNSGEILAFVSAPSYDPSSLTGGDFDENWKRLENDSLKPLYNRPLMARYPPGSIFKLAIALAALNEGIIEPQTYYRCGGGFWRNKGKPGCRLHVSPLKLDLAIQHSCNSYFAATYMDFLHHPKYGDIYTSFNKWRSYMDLMGIGRKLGVDLPYEKSGQLPTSKKYDDWYNKNWSATNIISNSIGQGEILMTPMQMANLSTIIANQGKYVRPHFLKAVRGEENHWNRVSYDTIHTGIDLIHFQMVADAMEQVVSAGTARRARIEGYAVCGKTGTVENPHGIDHSVFLGFAPKERPRIAIAVIIENAGGGGRWAAPLGAVMMEQYLRGKVQSTQWEHQRLMNASFD